MSHKRVNLLGMPLDAELQSQTILDRMQTDPVLLAYLNPLAWKIASDNPGLVDQLAAFDFVVCDGVGVQTAVQKLMNTDTGIISLDYSGIARDYLALCQSKDWSLCLVGGTEEVLKKAGDKLLADFPGLRITGSFPGYDDGPQRAGAFITENRTDLVLAGMGMGRQEPFLLALRQAGWQGNGIAVGGFFDKLADPGQDYPEWSERHNVRFLGRISRNPGRFIKRYTMDYMPFFTAYLKSRLTTDKQQNQS